MVKEGNKITMNLFSVLSEEVMNFATMVLEIYKKSKEDEKINMDDTVNVNVQQNFGMRSLWNCKKKEEEDQFVIEYTKFKDKYTPTDDFPIEQLSCDEN